MKNDRRIDQHTVVSAAGLAGDDGADAGLAGRGEDVPEAGVVSRAADAPDARADQLGDDTAR